MIVIIPMSGFGKRFSTAGYNKPKPLIPIKNQPMIGYVVENILENISTYTCPTLKFIFIINEEFSKNTSYMKELHRTFTNFYIDYEIIIETTKPEGAATSVLQAKHLFKDKEILIANCDQVIHDNQYISNAIAYWRKNKADGGIICFLDDSPKWSYARVSNGKIVEVAEKRVISNIATCGYYYYKNSNDFIEAVENMKINNIRVNSEIYVCPTYQQLIINDKKVLPYLVNEFFGLGTPNDLERYLKNE